MTRIGAAVGQFLADVRNQKLRTTLTLLGITWGTVAVVVLLAFGVGLERQTVKRFHGLGDRVVMLHEGHFIFDGTPEEMETSDVKIVRQFVEGRAEDEQLAGIRLKGKP